MRIQHHSNQTSSSGLPGLSKQVFDNLKWKPCVHRISFKLKTFFVSSKQTSILYTLKHCYSRVSCEVHLFIKALKDR